MVNTVSKTFMLMDTLFLRSCNAAFTLKQPNLPYFIGAINMLTGLLIGGSVHALHTWLMTASTDPGKEAKVSHNERNQLCQ